jgi:hypothetical protein
VILSALPKRAQLLHRSKFNVAANTFYGKYGHLPGDINAAAALQFGFAPRGSLRGQGDGNGVIEANFAGFNSNIYPMCGEQWMFWVDLGKVGLIESGINPGSYASNAWWDCTTQPTIP